METNSLPGRVQVTERVCELVKDIYECEERGELDIKGKGKLKCFFLRPQKKADGVPRRSPSFIDSSAPLITGTVAQNAASEHTSSPTSPKRNRLQKGPRTGATLDEGESSVDLTVLDDDDE